MQFDIVAEGLNFPEGPVVMPDGSVIVVEIGTGRVSRVWEGGRKEVVAVTGGGPNGAAIGPDGHLYVCNCGAVDFELRTYKTEGPDARGRIERIDLATGKVERLYESCNGRPLQGPNDLVVDREGGIWFTDLGKILQYSWTQGGLYYCKADGSSIQEIFSAPVNGKGFGAISFNGVGLSPDGSTIYVSDTLSTRVIAFDLAAPGKLAPGTGLLGAPDRPIAVVPGDLYLDSLAVTAAGRICVGSIVTGGISVVDPKKGFLEFIGFPDDYVTNIAFGGSDMQTAYITFSASGKLVRTRWPEPGLPLNF
jgi:gluconolactonase